MAFSFFRRKGDEPPNTVTPPKPVVPKPPPGAEKAAPAAAPEPEAIEFDDLSYTDASATAESHSAVEEAAILYANDRIVEASAVLLNFVKENAEARDLHPWLLLFDLYQTQGQKAQFEDLSMDFIVRFERSAPVWEGRQPAASKAVATRSSAGGGIKFKGQVGASAAADIESLLSTAEREGGVKLDLAGMTGIEPDSAVKLAGAMQKIRRGEKRLTVSGAREALQAVKALLEGARNEKRYWALMFELHQVLGMQAEFEDAAVDYAVTFELSPPSWEAMPETVQATVAEAEPEPQAAPETAMFVIEGVLDSNLQHKLGELERYAADRPDVQIDMTLTTRVDFMTIGAFIGTLSTVRGQGKSITIFGANEMLQALFAVMGVHEYAAIQRKKAR